MKILYDHQIFTGQKYGGISRYFSETINRLANNSNVEIDLGFRYTDNHYLMNSKFKKYIEPKPSSLDPIPYEDFKKFFPNLNFKGKGRLFNLSQTLKKKDPIDFTKELINPINENIKLSIEKIAKKDFDIFHPTYYEPYFLDYLGEKPFVLTVYDMTHEIYPEYFPLSDKTMTYKEKTIRKATKLIAISEQTKSDLVALFGIDPHKIEVIYLANSLPPIPKSIKLKIPEKYILYVGGRLQYKNFYFFARSFAKIQKKFPDLYLVCCGGGEFSKEEKDYLELLNIKKKVLSYQVTDTELSYIYSKAQFFIFPSLAEGFGIPIIEAFANNCPVLASEIPCFQELGGNAIKYFNPKNIDSIVEAAETVLTNSKYRQKLVKIGASLAKNFSWDKTAKETLSVYKEII